MRRRRTRLTTLRISSRMVTKDDEGVTVEAYSEPFNVVAEVWPAGGSVQAEVYGERLAYVRNCRIAEKYTTEKDGTLVYYRTAGGRFREKDRAVTAEGETFDIVSVKPYRDLVLELERVP